MKHYCENFILNHKNELSGKKVALFGSTGGIGVELCRYILSLGGELITVDRNPQKAATLKSQLVKEYSGARIQSLTADLQDIESVKTVCDALSKIGIDAVIHNAGAYSIPRKVLNTGYDNVFQINFLSPYYVTNRLLPQLKEKNGRVIIVGSIAHNYSKTDPLDIDFKNRKKASLVYGNAKRYLMYSVLELSKENPEVKFAVTHPGITFTNITAHYPKLIFAIIKHPMKVIFMRPKYAALSIIKGLFDQTEPYSWIGPRLFNVWGKPSKKHLKTANNDEIKHIYNSAKDIYNKMLLT